MNKLELIHEIHDRRRTTRLNELYYSWKLNFWHKIDLYSRIIIAATATGSGISGLIVFETSFGKTIWSVVTSASYLITFTIPFLKIADKILKYDKAVSGYTALGNLLEKTVAQLKLDDDYSDTVQKLAKEAQDKEIELIENPPDKSRWQWLINRYYEEVNKEMPANSLYIPEKIKNGNQTNQANQP